LHETLDFFVEWETLLTPFHSVSNNLDEDEEIILAHAVAESARVTAEHAKSDDTSKCALLLLKQIGLLWKHPISSSHSILLTQEQEAAACKCLSTATRAHTQAYGNAS